MARAFDITAPSGAVSVIRYDAAAGSPCLVLAHGAGAGQRSPFMVTCAEAVSARGVTVLTFDFPYVQRGRSAPDRPPVLEETWRVVLRYVSSPAAELPGPLVIGGKSMGGRIASQVLAVPIPSGDDVPERDLRADVAGLVLLGYPLHPPRQPERLRVAHLPALRTPTLVVQGERDEFGSETEVRDAFTAVPAPVDWLIVPGGDHSFRVRGTRPTADAAAGLHAHVAEWVLGRAAAVASA